MKILYIAPRYHTNQIPIMRGWKNRGTDIMFLAQFENKNEIHDDVIYHCMEKSWITKIIFNIVRKRKDPNIAENLEQKLFIPKYSSTKSIISSFHPDLVILRGRRIGNALIYKICKSVGISSVILYTQNPIYSDDNRHSKANLRSCIRKRIFPQIEFSPVYYIGKYRKKELSPDNAYFVPLITDLQIRCKSHGNVLRFLDIGKYRNYKNHFFVVDAIDRLPEQIKNYFSLTIVGQCSNSSEEEYYDKLQSYIREKKLDKNIILKKNIPFLQMEEIYNDFDVLILASKKETAGMVILEAMGNGLCVVSSLYCGLASYLDEYECGYVFDLDSPDNLSKIIVNLFNNPALAIEAGEKAQTIVKQTFSFENYVHALNNITIKEFGLNIEN